MSEELQNLAWEAAPHQGRLVKALPAEASVSLSVRVNGEPVPVVSDKPDGWAGVAEGYKSLRPPCS